MFDFYKKLKDKRKVYYILQNQMIQSLHLHNNPMYLYSNQQAEILAKKLDYDVIALLKPKPKWCPKWLYIKIIRDSVEIRYKK